MINYDTLNGLKHSVKSDNNIQNKYDLCETPQKNEFPPIFPISDLGTSQNPTFLRDLDPKMEGSEIEMPQFQTPEKRTTELSDILEREWLDSWVFGKADKTKFAYLKLGQDFFSFVHPRKLTDLKEQDLIHFLDWRKWQSPDTKKQKLAILRSLFKFLTRREVVTKDLALNLPSIKTNDKLTERYLSEEEVMRMMTMTENFRDRTVIKLLYGGGVRVSELVSLNWNNVQDRENGTGQITVTGKRNKKRTILLSHGTYRELRKLKLEYSKIDGPILMSNRKQRLSVRMVQVIIDQARLRAGILKKVSPHWLRHAHASHSLDRGAPIHLVQSTLGHASVATTGRYLHSRPGESSGKYLGI